MKKKLIIHIGLAKTGTTTIQDLAKQHRVSLATNGIDYVPVGFPRRFGIVELTGQQNLAWEINGNKGFRKRFGTWQALHGHIEVSDKTIFLISSEFFATFNQEHVRKLLEETKQYDVDVVLTLRNQLERFFSLFSEFAKTGDEVELRSFMQAMQNDRTFNHYDLITRWQGVFGKDALKVLLFEDLKKDMFNTFMRQIFEQSGLGYTLELKSSQKNVGYDYKSLVHLQTLTQRASKFLGEPLTRYALLPLVRKFGWGVNPKNSKTLPFLEEEASRFLAAFQEQNKRVNDLIALPSSYFSVAHLEFEK